MRDSHVNPLAIFEFLSKVEPISWLAALGVLYLCKQVKEYRPLAILLAVKFFNAVSFDILMLHVIPTPLTRFQAYSLFFNLYWVFYLASTIATFFLIELIVKRTLAPLSGLSSLSSAVFRGTGCLAVVIAVTAHLPELRTAAFNHWLMSLFLSFALCMCIFELSLLSMLFWTIRRLGLSLRSRIFGLSIGLAAMGTMDFTSNFSVASHEASMYLDMMTQMVIIFTLSLWIVYMVLPEPKRRPLQLAASSTLLRWNEVVSKLGIGPQPIAQPGTTFMTDVVDVVDRILMRNAVRK